MKFNQDEAVSLKIIGFILYITSMIMPEMAFSEFALSYIIKIFKLIYKTKTTKTKKISYFENYEINSINH